MDYKATSVGNRFQMVHSNVVSSSLRVHTPEKNSSQALMKSHYIPLKHQELITQWCNIISQKNRLQLQTPLLRFYIASSTETKHQLWHRHSWQCKYKIWGILTFNLTLPASLFWYVLNARDLPLYAGFNVFYRHLPGPPYLARYILWSLIHLHCS
jgi:hypothetical protein